MSEQDNEDSFTIKDLEESTGEQYADGWYKPFPIDLKKLQRFIEVEITFRQNLNGVTRYISQPMRRCTSQDFLSKGYTFTS